MKNLYKILTALLMIAAVVLTAQAAWGAVDINNVKVNNIAVSSGATVEFQHVMQPLKLSFNLNNTDNQSTITVDYDVLIDGKKVASSATLINLPAATSVGSGDISLPGMDFGTHSAKISVTRGNVLTELNFNLNVVGPSKIVITEFAFDTNTASCKGESRILSLSASNFGTSSETVTINVKGPINDSKVLTLAAGQKGSTSFTIDTSKLVSGNYNFVAELVYGNGIKITSTGLGLVKSSCITSTDPASGASFTLENIQSRVFTVNTVDNLAGSWTLDNNALISGVNINTFNLSAKDYTVGDHTLKFTVGTDSVSWPVKITQHVDTAAALQASSLSTISLVQSNLGTTLTKTVTLSNPGTLSSVTGLTYNSSVSGITVSGLKNIPAQGSIEVTLSIVVPSTLSTGERTFGTVTFRADNNLSALLDVKVNYASLLRVTDVEINGDNNGEITPESDNTVDVTVRNEYTKDIENIVVTATLKDVDNDDLEEESEEFDLNDGEDDTVTLTFDLSGELLDEDSYTLEITVSGEDVDGNDQETTYTEIVDVSRDSHKIILRNVDLSSSSVQCLKQTTLNVEVRNVGKSNENNVEIKVRNTALGIDLSKKEIDLDKYSGNDNSYEATFNLEIENVKAGTYPLSVESYLDGDLEDSVIVNLEVRDCGSGSTSMGSSSNYDQLAANLQKQLQAELEAQKANAQKSIVPVETSFRDSNAYLWMLGALGVLIAIAVILGLAAVSKK